jgi:hypothetical protein
MVTFYRHLISLELPMLRDSDMPPVDPLQPMAKGGFAATRFFRYTAP